MGLINKKFLGGLAVGFVVFPFLFFAAAFIFVKAIMGGRDMGKLPPPEMPHEQAVSLNWNVSTLDGQAINLGQASQGRPVFVNFWATWCPSCVAEMPNIERLHDTFKDRVFFACISTEEPKALKEFAASKGLRMPLYKMYGGRPPGLETSGVPVTFLISPEGKVLLKHAGAADWSHETVVAYLTRLLKERENTPPSTPSPPPPSAPPPSP